MNKRIIKKFLPKWLKSQLWKVRLIMFKIRNGLKQINTQFLLTEIGESGTDTYFGYYDISPFNGKDELLYLEVARGEQCAKVIWNDLSKNNIRVITTTNAFNTQQGARLRWYPGSNEDIIFNDFIDEKYVSRKVNINTQEEYIIPYPLYDISPDGKYGITLNFERLGVLRPGYGYTNRKYKPAKDLSEEGISLINMNTGKVKQVLTYKKIADSMGERITDYSLNYINHLSFSPDGRKFLFFWLKNVPNWTNAALLTYDIETNHIAVLETNLRVSHYTWKDNDNILCTAIAGTSVHDMQCRYYLYQEGKPRQIVGEDLLRKDGHPTYYKENVILSDTYPDRHSFQELFLYDMKNNIKKRLVYSFSVPVKDGVYRTDMHPRFNSDKSIICYDANVSGERKLFILKNWH